jgi:hypothetical protein
MTLKKKTIYDRLELKINKTLTKDSMIKIKNSKNKD